MKKTLKLPVELDCPEKQQIGIGIFYGLFAFFAMPFFVYFLMADLQDPYLLTWFEFAYHLINFIVVVSLFREYLQDGLFMFRLRKKEYFFSVKLAMLSVVAIVALVYIVANVSNIPWLFTTLISIFPLSEMEIMFLGGDMTYFNPLLSLLCAVVLAPVTTVCLFYGTGFAPAFRVRPWLGYLAVAAWIAFTHIRNAVTPWDLSVEILLYVVQLPIHLIACWTYKKTNNICTPIITLAIANLLAWGYLVVQLFLV